MDIKPIETHYNGYRFRSRLEARWAVFFDVLGIKYEYEPEGYSVDIGEERIQYLPDFYLPDFDVFCEVKPSLEKLLEDKEKIAWAIDYNATPVAKGLLILGQIPYWKNSPQEKKYPTFYLLYWDKGIRQTYATFGTVFINNERKVWLIREDTGGYECTSAPDIPMSIERDWEDLFLFGCPIYHFENGITYELDSVHTSLIQTTIREAYIKARKARFEHGEKG